MSNDGTYLVWNLLAATFVINKINILVIHLKKKNIWFVYKTIEIKHFSSPSINNLMFIFVFVQFVLT